MASTSHSPPLTQGHSTSTILDCKTNPAQYVLVQGWQLLALAISLFLPRNNRLLWYLKLHLQRNADSKELQEKLQEKWIGLRGRSVVDCVRIYLTCTRKWPFFGATLYQAKLKQSETITLWIAVSEDSVTLLELQTMVVMYRYNYANIVTFGGCLDDFMLVACPDEGAAEQKLLFELSKPKILEITLLIADYMNALGHALPGTPQMNTLTRNGSHRSIKSAMRPTTGND
ncbi:hypothetical protein PV327_005287 [Microctonus hyperodae]|uniref:MyTH4 domain-containing protein n=1 Tax=Microctonus hyperodae TaxID=165561 RepID=A0AA39KZK3_MICHY|nr:hypothetical protein PV327_005287 [Microctonus hyperodae]